MAVPAVRRQRRVKRQVVLGALVLLVAFGVGEISLRWGWLDVPENGFYDLWHTMAGERSQARNVVIVSVDNQTLLAHRDEPLVFWGPLFGRGIEVLRGAGARVIGLDFLFMVSAEAWLRKLEMGGIDASRTYDIPMRRQLAEGSVVLIGVVASDERGDSDLLLPIEDYLFSLPGGAQDVGFANFYTDPDGVVRQFVTALFEEGPAPRLTFATLLAVRSAGLGTGEGSWPMGGVEVANGPYPRAIGFMGPPGTVPRISFSRLLAPDAENDPALGIVKGKVAIVAAEHVGLQDIHLTPYARTIWSSEGTMMSGPEVHANIVETLLTGVHPRAVPRGLRMGLAFFVTLAGTVLFFRLNPWKGLAAAAGLCVGYGCLAYALFLGNWTLPVGNAQAALAMAFLGVMGFRLTGEERDRERLRQMFGRYVSDEVVERLLAMRHRPDLGGEAVEVTVLFSDIRGFTTISERLTAHEVVEMLNAYFSRSCEPILQQGGTVNKFIGDAVMAMFGSPVPYPDHARRAVRAALAMARTAEEFRTWMNGRFGDRGLPEFRVGIGLHTGEAVVGDIGSPKRTEFTAIGDTVNTASRLEGKTKDLGWAIVASEATIRAAGSGVRTGGQATVPVKGRTGQVVVFGVTGLEEGKGGES